MSKPAKKVTSSTQGKSNAKKLKPTKIKKSQHKSGEEKEEESHFDAKLQLSSEAVQNSDDLLETHVAVPKAQTINLSLLARRCISNCKSHQPQQIIELLNEVTHVRLDRENLQNIDGLELLDGNKVKNLYLQHNELKDITGLETLTALRFLTLSNNKIQSIQNIRNIKLGFLDLSYNEIQELQVDELPSSLVILSLEGNPCQHTDGYKDSILSHCPNLSQLDGVRLTASERRAAGHDVISESEESDDEEEDIEAHSSYDYNKPFDAQIIGVFDDLSSDMFERCRSRIQNIFDAHKSRVLNLEKIKSDGGIVLDEGVSNPASRISSRLDSPDTTDSSRPATGNTLLDNVSIIDEDDDEDLGFRLAQTKLTNAAVAANRLGDDSINGMSSLNSDVPSSHLRSSTNAWEQRDESDLPLNLLS